MSDKTRVTAFVDGFNLYHGIKEMVGARADVYGRSPNHLKWVDLWKLVLAFTKPSQETLAKVYYFSAYAKWLEQPYRRHMAYVAALKGVGVTVVLGEFKERKHLCKRCQTVYTSHEEKETDVNLALWLLRDAMTRSFDKAIIVTGDADLKPAVQMVRDHDPGLLVHSLLPENRHRAAHDFRKVCHESHKFGIGHLERSLLPEVLNAPDGRLILRPPEYAPSA
jgi:uncharacterized LabA/DUF88 family protein